MLAVIMDPFNDSSYYVCSSCLDPINKARYIQIGKSLDAIGTNENTCDCGKTKVITSDGATYPYSDDSPSLQCNACGTFVKYYKILEV